MLKKLIHLLISFSAFSICYLLAFLTEIPVLQNVILYIFVIQWVLFIPAYVFQTEKCTLSNLDAVIAFNASIG